MRPMLEDVPDEVLWSRTGRAQAVTTEWHSLLLRGLVSIPRVEPGDTVWWHSDVVHGVEDIHQGNQMSSVIYIGAALYVKETKHSLKDKSTFLEEKFS